MIYREKVDRWIVEKQGHISYRIIRVVTAIILIPIIILPILIEMIAPFCEKFNDYISIHNRRWSAFLLNKINKNYCHLETK